LGDQAARATFRAPDAVVKTKKKPTSTYIKNHGGEATGKIIPYNPISECNKPDDGGEHCSAINRSG